MRLFATSILVTTIIACSSHGFPNDCSESCSADETCSNGVCVPRSNSHLAPTSTSTTSSPSVNVSGSWSTQWGSSSSPMHLSQSGTSVTGSYDLSTSSGSIEGTLSGLTLTGTYNDKYGSGNIKFVFASDGNSFHGTWGSSGATWNGQRN